MVYIFLYVEKKLIKYFWILWKFIYYSSLIFVIYCVKLYNFIFKIEGGINVFIWKIKFGMCFLIVIRDVNIRDW